MYLTNPFLEIFSSFLSLCIGHTVSLLFMLAYKLLGCTKKKKKEENLSEINENIIWNDNKRISRNLTQS